MWTLLNVKQSKPQNITSYYYLQKHTCHYFDGILRKTIVLRYLMPTIKPSELFFFFGDDKTIIILILFTFFNVWDEICNTIPCYHVTRTINYTNIFYNSIVREWRFDF